MNTKQQWQAFSPEYVASCGFTPEFNPFKAWASAVKGQALNGWSGYSDITYIGCRTIKSHVDSAFQPIYSALLVLRNDGCIAKPSRLSKYKLEPQLIGSILLLKVHKQHHCIPDQRLPKREDNWWIAAYKDFAELPSRESIQEIFLEFLEDKKSILSRSLEGKKE